jgi:dipeptidyl aminopeptidase/acylaminoacyl peptidase
LDIAPDGRSLVWFDDRTGDEVGTWIVESFEGGDSRELLTGLEPGWESGFAWGGSEALVGRADGDGFAIHAVRIPEPTPPRLLYHHQQEAQALAISPDDQLILISISESGDTIHPDLLVLGAAEGARLATLNSNGAAHFLSADWSPAIGSPVLALNDDAEGHLGPSLWWPLTGALKRLRTGLHGEVEAIDWYPDGRALLLLQLLRGRHRLWSYGIEDGKLERVPTPAGTCSPARVRPDGRVWALCSSGATPPRALDLSSGKVVVDLPAAPNPSSAGFRDWNYRSAGGYEVHGFLARPRGAGPYGTVIWVHGGPQAHVEDAFSPGIAALLDQGLMVAAPNYRGSTGYGRTHMDQLNGNPGFPEVEDVVSGVADLIHKGLADPARVVLMGASWGGYITLLGLGLHPTLFVAGVARVPVGDYVLAYEEESRPLQAMDESLFGGAPKELPELYRERSPITYAQRLAVPVLVQAGENDSRCPYHQVEVYVRRLEELEKKVSFSHYRAGHSAMVVEQDITLMQEALDFLRPLLHLA